MRWTVGHVQLIGPFMDVKLLRVKTIAFLRGNHNPGILLLHVTADVWGRSPHGELVRPTIDFPIASSTATIVQMGQQHIMVGMAKMDAPVHAGFLEIDLFLSDVICNLSPKLIEKFLNISVFLILLVLKI